jgi:HNH endonuclease
LSRNPPAGKCVHCLKVFDQLTWDHVFPKSWYPNTTPENLSKWKVPSCRECNSQLGAIEEEFFRLIGLCLDPGAPAAQGIVPKVLRSMRAADKNSERENNIRESLRRKVIEGVLEGTNIPSGGVIPGLHERWDRPTNEQVAFTIPADNVHRITEKIVRGISYIADEQFIAPPYAVNFFILAPDDASPIRQVLDVSGETFSCGPGIIVRRAIEPEDNTTAIFEIEFWGQFKTYSSVTRD